jgi:hypothetical protein
MLDVVLNSQKKLCAVMAKSDSVERSSHAAMQPNRVATLRE